MPLQPRDRLGPYEIQALLGVGGMGEVYRGRDTRLGRDVALKVISPDRVENLSLRRRFELEARAASVLNHPSIVTIYDVGETEGVSWIAMEWVEGRTLRDALLEGPLSIRDALSISKQIAEGLAEAHAKGIVHRDLKPENVMLASSGRTKILDFGLARQNVGDSLESAGSRIETLAVPPGEPTVEGTILGTVGYMSPEQASGRPVDFRSDQFSFGLIVYEMLARRRAFQCPTAVQTLSAIISEEPVPLSSIRPEIPPPLQNFVARCLSKRIDDRFASTRELVVALEFLGTGVPASASSAPSEALTEVGIAPAPSVSVETRRGFRPAVVVVTAFALALAAAAAWRWFGASRNAISSLAVLPFANASGDPDAEYLSDGLTESLIDQMFRVPSLKVMARATVFRFKGSSDPQDAGRKLGVGAVLTGAVSRRGDQLSISAELLDVATGVRLWGEKYERPFAELLRVQDSIAAGIADGLHLRLSGEERRALGGHGTANAEAYELALKARYFFLKQTEEGYLEARRLYREAVEKDPKFADAHLGVAITYGAMVVEGFEPPAEGQARYEEEVRKALDLDPGNVPARCAVAVRRFYYEWDWARAGRDFAELQNDPRLFLGDTFRPMALYLWAAGRPDEAVALMERALRIDPDNRDSKMMRADFLAQAGKLEDAIGAYRAISAAEPSDPAPLFGLAEVLRRRGDVAGAIETLRKAYGLAGEEGGAKALSAARTEKDYENAETAVARSRLEEIEVLAKERYVSPFNLARLRAQVGDREKAFASLEAAFAERASGLVFLKADRAWDRIRDDARFASLVRRVGIP